MIGIAITLVVSLALSMALTPLAKRTALRTGVVSIPRTRDIHIDPVPMLGGAAIYVAFVVTLFFFSERDYIRELMGILLGATLLAAVGLADDRWGLSASLRMGVQVLAAILLIIGGTQVKLFPIVLPVGIMNAYLLPYEWLNWVVTIVWVVGITNALNFLDNMDGLSGGIATIGAAFFLLLASMNEPRQVLVGAMAAALMGACIGFLRYNLNPANIFMGDTGSLFLGFILAVLGIKLRFPANTPVITWMVPVCVLALPIFDTTMVFISRMRRGDNPFTTPGKDHISHRLVAMGMTKRESVLTCYLIAGASGMVATFLTQARPTEAIIVAVGLVATIITGVIWFERICPSGVPRKQHQQSGAEPYAASASKGAP